MPRAILYFYLNLLNGTPFSIEKIEADKVLTFNASKVLVHVPTLKVDRITWRIDRLIENTVQLYNRIFGSEGIILLLKILKKIRRHP
jgi:hypothetical protein